MSARDGEFLPPPLSGMVDPSGPRGLRETRASRAKPCDRRSVRGQEKHTSHVSLLRRERKDCRMLIRKFSPAASRVAASALALAATALLCARAHGADPAVPAAAVGNDTFVVAQMNV